MSYEAVTDYLRACNAAADAGVAYPAMDGLADPEQARVTRFISLANPDGHAAPEVRQARTVAQTGPSPAESPGAIGGGNRATLETYLANLAPITQEGEQ